MKVHFGLKVQGPELMRVHNKSRLGLKVQERRCAASHASNAFGGGELRVQGDLI
jgi:hypothetical protein